MSHGRILIKDGTLIDGTGCQPVMHAAVLIENGLIKSTGAEAARDAQDGH